MTCGECSFAELVQDNERSWSSSISKSIRNLVEVDHKSGLHLRVFSSFIEASLESYFGDRLLSLDSGKNYE